VIKATDGLDNLARTGCFTGSRIFSRSQGRLRLQSSFYSLHHQQQQIFVVTDLNVSPKWEINIGVGVGPTASTDHWIIKGILGRHFNWKKESPID
jgi:hypothetical protein